MGKYFKLFKTHAEYEAYIANLDDKSSPIVSYCLDEEERHFEPSIPETRIIATFNVGTTSTPTKILEITSAFTKVEIDGVEMSPISSGYTFSTTGIHEVKYTLSDQTIINENAFSSCSVLATVKIPKGVVRIDNDAFMGCIALSSVTISNTVTSIGGNAFYGCSNLRDITSFAKVAPTITNTTFRDVREYGVLITSTSASGYDVWLGDGDYYLGSYGWEPPYEVSDEGL